VVVALACDAWIEDSGRVLADPNAGTAIETDVGGTGVPRPEGLEPGAGFVRVAHVGGRSVVVRRAAASPLRLLVPRAHGGAAWIFTSTFGGGLVDDDDIALEAIVDAGARALVSTQASTKVYRSVRGTSSSLHASVASGATMIVLPDPVVAFAGARYRQVQTFALDPDARLVVLDWIVAGRTARGERWMFDEYMARLDVRIGERLVVHDVLRLAATDGDIGERMSRFDVLAVVVIAGPDVERDIAACQSLADAERPRRDADRLLAAAPIPGGGVFRVAGTSVEAVARIVRQALAFVPEWLGDDPWRRKW
jgi:urease accessory protein